MLAVVLLLPVIGRAQMPPQAADLVAKATAEMKTMPLDALALFAQAQALYEKAGDTSGAAGCLLSSGDCCYLLKRWAQALAKYEAAIPLFVQTKEAGRQALAWQTEGAVYMETGPVTKAISCYETAVALYRTASAPKSLGRALMYTARAYNQSGQARKALPLYAEAATVYEAQQDVKHQAGALLGVSQCYLEQYDNANGLRVLQQGLALSREAKDPVNEAIFLHNLAGAYANSGDYRKALDAFTTVLPLLVDAEYPQKEANCLNNMGLLAFRIGDFLPSLGYLNRALEKYQAAKDNNGIASTRDNLAIEYDYLGETETALEQEREALKASEAGGNVRWQALAWEHLSRMEDAQNHHAEAQADIEKALRLYYQAGDENGAAYARYALAEMRRDAGKAAEARDLLNAALAGFVKTGDGHGVGDCAEALGEISESAGRFEDAMKWYEKALMDFTKVGSALGAEKVLEALGLAQIGLGRLDNAEEFYAQALLHQESLRGSLGSLSEVKSRFQAGRAGMYQRYIGLLLARNETERAFDWAQKAKARSLIDLMDAGLAPPQLPPDALARQADLQKRGNVLTTRWLASLGDWNDLRRQAKPDATRKAHIERQINDVKREQARLEGDWRTFQEQSALRDTRPVPQPARTVSLAEVAAFLPEDTALLEYTAVRSGSGKSAREQTALFVVTRKGNHAALHVVVLKAGNAALARDAREFREACAAPPNTSAERPYKSVSRELYDLLIAPAASSLVGVKRLIVCPEGPLWDVPFQALLLPTGGTGNNPRSAFLWEKYSIVYANSATACRETLMVRNRLHRPAPTETLLVVANPDFGAKAVTMAAHNRRPGTKSDVRGSDLPPQFGAFAPLPSTQIEADAIKRAFPEAVVKTGADAQEGFVKQAAVHYRYLHFATHAVLNDTAPLLSGIALAKPPPNSAEDGLLTARELFDLPLSAEMAVFSACETGRGVNQPGEGLIGLTWAAFAAGVPAQVVSQWAVDDAATAELMGSFYRGLKRGQSKDAALRSAALALLGDGRHSHPFYWGPFIVLGDWR